MSWEKLQLKVGILGGFESPEALRQNLYGIGIRTELNYRFDLDSLAESLQGHSIDVGLYYSYAGLLAGYTFPRALDGEGNGGSRNSVGALVNWVFRFSPGELRTGIGLGAGLIDVDGVEGGHENNIFRNHQLTTFDFIAMGGASFLDRAINIDVHFLIARDQDDNANLGVNIILGTDILSVIRQASEK